MDSHFLVQNLYNICTLCDAELGMISLDQWIIISFLLYELLEISFVSVLGLLYKNAFCLVKMYGGA